MQEIKTMEQKLYRTEMGGPLTLYIKPGKVSEEVLQWNLVRMRLMTEKNIPTDKAIEEMEKLPALKRIDLMEWANFKLLNDERIMEYLAWENIRHHTIGAPLVEVEKDELEGVLCEMDYHDLETFLDSTCDIPSAYFEH